MQGRLYDARIGRFMQADPPFMESPGWSQGLNRYSYVFNNPLNRVDPSGFYAETEDDTTVEDPDEVIWDPTCQGPGCDTEDGSANLSDEAQTSPSGAADDDQSAVGRDRESAEREHNGGWTDAELAAARHEAYKAAAYAEDRENAERGQVEPPTLDDLQNVLDVVSASLGATGVGEVIAWVPDIANAGISLGRGDKTGAVLSMVAAAPGVGMIANTTRIAKYTAKATKVLVQAHHAIPKFLGGFAKQVLAQIPTNVHTAFHRMLATSLKAKGIPLNVGGKGGSAADWARYFNANPGAQAKALDAVLEASRATDASFGTQITSAVWENLMHGNFTPYP
jgi:hypothetical protein